jgi:hypothetical protein
MWIAKHDLEATVFLGLVAVMVTLALIVTWL